MWKERLKDLITTMGIEINTQGKTVVFTCPRELDWKEQTLLISNIPTHFKYKFETNYKSATIKALYSLIVLSNLTHKVIGNKIILYLDSINIASLDNINWVKIIEVIKKDGFFKSWEIKVNGKSFKPNLLAEEIAHNNQIREKIIKEDDVNNFLITLNTSGDLTLEQFLERI